MASKYANLLDPFLGAKVVDVVEESPADTVLILKFSNKGEIFTGYWRLVENGKKSISSFDHKQKYGLPEPVDAIKYLSEKVSSQKVRGVKFVEETGDLELVFENGHKLQMFNFTGYEDWHVRCPDGTGEYSNYVFG